MHSLYCKKSILFLAMILLLLISSQLFARDYVSTMKSPTKFTKIQSDDFFDVNIHKGKSFEVKAYGTEADLKKVLIRVEDEALQIRYVHSPFLSLKHEQSVRVEVTMPELESVVTSGSGSVVSKDKFEGDELTITTSGSGNILFSDINYQSANVDISGSGNINLAGSVMKLDMAVAGSGSLDCEKLKSEEAEIAVSGSGEAKVNATKTLNATVTGSGSIYYLGKPTLNRIITGSGDISPLKSGSRE